jgi:hypothetical protein
VPHPYGAYAKERSKRSFAKIFNDEAANSGVKIEVHDFFRGSLIASTGAADAV